MTIARIPFCGVGGCGTVTDYPTDIPGDYLIFTGVAPDWTFYPRPFTHPGITIGLLQAPLNVPEPCSFSLVLMMGLLALTLAFGKRRRS